MKRVILIGDSIRMGYEATVRAELSKEAFVWAPPENCQHTVHVMLNFWKWVISQQPDVLHMNAGLWDMRRVIRDEEGNIVPLETYRTNVDRLITAARQHTKARIIWATCTPCDQAGLDRAHMLQGLAGRSTADIARYNEAAIEVARHHKVALNDLHQLVVDAGPASLQEADGVHFTPAGYELLGRAVAETIRRHW